MANKTWSSRAWFQKNRDERTFPNLPEEIALKNGRFTHISEMHREVATGSHPCDLIAQQRGAKTA